MDAFIDIFLILPYIVLVALSTSFLTQKMIEIRLIDGFTLYLATIYSFLSYMSIISQIIHIPLLDFFPFSYTRFQYIRGSLGISFLAFIFSIFSYHRTPNIIIKSFLAFGICSPIILVPIIPWSLELHGLSWVHLFD